MNISKFFKKIVGDTDHEADHEYEYNENQNSTYNSGYNQNYKKEDLYHTDMSDTDFSDLDDADQYENNISNEIFKNTKLDIKIELYEDSSHIYIKALVFGVEEEDVYIDISRDTVVLSGKRESQHIVEEEAYFVQEIE
jgi:HSP20 family molecular chaperone IbpA